MFSVLAMFPGMVAVAAVLSFIMVTMLMVFKFRESSSAPAQAATGGLKQAKVLTRLPSFIRKFFCKRTPMSYVRRERRNGGRERTIAAVQLTTKHPSDRNARASSEVLPHPCSEPFAARARVEELISVSCAITTATKPITQAATRVACALPRTRKHKTSRAARHIQADKVDPVEVSTKNDSPVPNRPHKRSTAAGETGTTRAMDGPSGLPEEARRDVRMLTGLVAFFKAIPTGIMERPCNAARLLIEAVTCGCAHTKALFLSMKIRRASVCTNVSITPANMPGCEATRSPSSAVTTAASASALGVTTSTTSDSVTQTSETSQDAELLMKQIKAKDELIKQLLKEKHAQTFRINYLTALWAVVCNTLVTVRKTSQEEKEALEKAHEAKLVMKSFQIKHLTNVVESQATELEAQTGESADKDSIIARQAATIEKLLAGKRADERTSKDKDSIIATQAVTIRKLNAEKANHDNELKIYKELVKKLYGYIKGLNTSLRIRLATIMTLGTRNKGLQTTVAQQKIVIDQGKSKALELETENGLMKKMYRVMETEKGLLKKKYTMMAVAKAVASGAFSMIRRAKAPQVNAHPDKITELSAENSMLKAKVAMVNIAKSIAVGASAMKRRQRDNFASAWRVEHREKLRLQKALDNSNKKLALLKVEMAKQTQPQEAEPSSPVEFGVWGTNLGTVDENTPLKERHVHWSQRLGVEGLTIDKAEEL